MPVMASPESRRVSLSDDEYEMREASYKRTYRPISTLPTPPPSSRNSSATHSPRTGLEDGERLEASYLGKCWNSRHTPFRAASSLFSRSSIPLTLCPLAGPAIHLVNLIPPGASFAYASVPVVHALLTRAALPLDIVALAACILDSLDAKFSLKWRLSLPLNNNNNNNTLTTTPPPSSPPASATQQRFHHHHHHHHCHKHAHSTPLQPTATNHIDSVPPELLVLAALVIATKFLDDHAGQREAAWFADVWGRGLWTAAQVSATERCMAQHLGYRIMPLYDAELIADAKADMQTAAELAAEAEAEQEERQVSAAARGGGDDAGARRCVSSGPALGLGLLTPLDTPSEEKAAPAVM